MASTMNMLESAIAHHQAGRLQQAEEIYRQILQEDPSHSDALHLLGLIAYQVAKWDIALELIEKAIALKPMEPLYYFHYGLVLEALKKHEEAFIAFLCSAELDPQEPKTEKALLRQHTENPELLVRLGDFCFNRGRFETAEGMYRKALHHAPDYARAYNNLASTVEQQNGPTDAVIENYLQAIRLRPDFIEAYYNLGVVFLATGCVDEAIDKFKQALDIQPDYALAKVKLSEVLLLKGNYAAGWNGYHARLNLPGWDRIYPHVHEKPMWDGSSFHGKRLLIHGEQGFGDTIQFIRYLPMVKSLGGTVIFETRKPILGLFNHFPGIDELRERVAEDIRHFAFDLYIHTLSLPGIFNTTLETIPSQIPYIYPDLQKVDGWKDHLKKDGFKVGLVWAGSPEHKNDRNRSCALTHFLPLADIPGVYFYGLQKGDAASQIKTVEGRMPVINIGDDFKDFTDTAGAIANLDLVISVDTAMVHLAGAMGKRIWTLIPYAPDWRWMLNRIDTPWYPTMKLFRQPTPGDWDSVFGQVKDALSSLVHSGGKE
ncbi:MAG: tetratricopeptide repeat protein [Proteobacteria bacterium]|nr:tetratricopeptide repeat protein [Pseudomonadota bacterium]